MKAIQLIRHRHLRYLLQRYPPFRRGGVITVKSLNVRSRRIHIDFECLTHWEFILIKYFLMFNALNVRSRRIHIWMFNALNVKCWIEWMFNVQCSMSIYLYIIFLRLLGLKKCVDTHTHTHTHPDNGHDIHSRLTGPWLCCKDGQTMSRLLLAWLERTVWAHPSIFESRFWYCASPLIVSDRTVPISPPHQARSAC